ncbi:MAG: hypothetical protein C0481_19910 [Phenylobacterium sp.]|uniref:terminase small subunit-like protein n=1 Tax=Phenylobacterium sp. TaxID=1871053 RepID=UPI0025D6DA52|nr:hypothetical protein [Phenylobacterium sp.]MBA4014131.1 hypothetical protein [Phenylobacterium sp.]
MHETTEPDGPRKRAATPFCEETAAQICARVSAGESLRAICKPRHMPGAATVHRWAAVRPAFGAALRQAQAAAQAARRDAYRAGAADRAWKRARPWARPDAYRAEVGEEICRRLASGRSLLEICGEADMPVTGTVYEWLRAHDDFAAMYRQARRMQAEMLADLAWAIASEAQESDIKVARLQFDVLRWRAARLAPKAYREAECEQENGAKGGFEVYLQDFSSGAILAGPIWSGPGA